MKSAIRSEMDHSNLPAEKRESSSKVDRYDVKRSEFIRLTISGCYLQNSFNTILMPGESRIVDGKRHECQDMGPGKVRYTVKSRTFQVVITKLIFA